MTRLLNHLILIVTLVLILSIALAIKLNGESLTSRDSSAGTVRLLPSTTLPPKYIYVPNADGVCPLDRTVEMQHHFGMWIPVCVSSPVFIPGGATSKDSSKFRWNTWEGPASVWKSVP
jgi:hypothetical protein